MLVFWGQEVDFYDPPPTRPELAGKLEKRAKGVGGGWRMKQ